MGTKLAPALATTYTGDLGDRFLSQYPKKTIWPHTLGELNDLLSRLNNVQKKIKFVAEISTQSCNFLDLIINLPHSLAMGYSPPNFSTNPHTHFHTQWDPHT